MSLILMALAAAGSDIPTEPAARAAALVEAHQVSKKVPCSVPLPTVWNAPAWEQEAGARRRRAFNECLDGVMRREQNLLEQLTYQVNDLHAAVPDADWSAIEHALNAKWAELEEVESKLRLRENWANTAVSILDTFTGPGAPFDSSGMAPAASALRPFGYGIVPGYNPAYRTYRRDSSTSAGGIK